jgi:hypothetical protein
MVDKGNLVDLTKALLDSQAILDQKIAEFEAQAS